LSCVVQFEQETRNWSISACRNLAFRMGIRGEKRCRPFKTTDGRSPCSHSHITVLGLCFVVPLFDLGRTMGLGPVEREKLIDTHWGTRSPHQPRANRPGCITGMSNLKSGSAEGPHQVARKPYSSLQLPNSNIRCASTDQHPKRCSRKDGPEDGTPFVNEDGGRFDGGFITLNVDQKWNVILPAEHEEVGRNCRGEQREMRRML
jgi:hypothetical protein